MSTESDLAETAREVEALDRRIVTAKADVRDLDALKKAIDEGVAHLGRLDIVCANAGIATTQEWDQVTPQVWQDTLDTNLTGVWNTFVATIPHLIASGGGSIIATSSVAGVKGLPFLQPYVAAKFGVTGLVKAMANELAVHNIRVNSVHPTGVRTPLADGLSGMEPLKHKHPDLALTHMNAMPGVDGIESVDVSNAILFLASDESRYVTGLEMRVDAGNTIR
jgi:NAD(P)-dependent dehydrogenase (short-subunit alcohol dehydrogenase family)